MRSAFKAIVATGLAAASSLAPAALLTYSVTGVLNGEVLSDASSALYSLPLFDRGTPITFTVVVESGTPVLHVQPFGTAYHADVADAVLGSRRFDAKSLCPTGACTAVVHDGETDSVTVMGPLGAMPLPGAPRANPSWLLAQVRLQIADPTGGLLDDEAFDVDLARVPLSLVRGSLALGAPDRANDVLLGFDVMSIAAFDDIDALALAAPGSAALAMIGLLGAALRGRGIGARSRHPVRRDS